MFATHEQVCDMLLSEGIQPWPVDDRVLATNIPRWQEGLDAKFISDQAFFSALGGLEVVAMDVSGLENPDYLHDMNLLIPADLMGKFSLVVDGGTLEHIFDIKQALQNIARLLKPGGRVIHLAPTNNYVEHAFYQFSPSLFYEYYWANGFTDLQCLIFESTGQFINEQWSCYVWDTQRPYVAMQSTYLLGTIFVAEKTDDSTFDKIPQQGQFLVHPIDQQIVLNFTTIPMSRKVKNLIKEYMPAELIILLRRMKNVLHRDLSLKPWGLKYLGKL